MRKLLVAPLFFWYITYTLAPFFPDALRPTINVHLAHIDEALFSVLPHQLMTLIHSPILDVFAAIPYTLHVLWPILFLLWCIRHSRDKLLLPYVNVFGIVSFSAVLTELAFPCAPPWYLEKYGFAPASYDLPGDPGGLLRLDNYWQTNFYGATFDKSPLVFGAFPSLHVAWPTILTLFIIYGGITPSKLKKTIPCVYLMWVIFSVLYLHHHFFVDVIGGLAYAGLVYHLVGPHRDFSRERLKSFSLRFYSMENGKEADNIYDDADRFICMR